MQEEKLKGYLNIAIKAGKVVFGADNILGWKKKLFGVVVCETASIGTRDRLEHFANERGFGFVVISGGKTLAELVGRENIKVIAITNKNLYTIIEVLVKGGFSMTI